MPALREWQVNYPTYWTQPQARAYVQDATHALTMQIVPIAQAVGPLQTTAILHTLIVSMVRANPVYAHDIQGQMANTYDLVDRLRVANDVPAGVKAN